MVDQREKFGKQRRRRGYELSFRWLVCLSAFFGTLVLGNDSVVVAATTSSRTYSLFNGRTRITAPTSATTPKKLGSKTYLVRPKSRDKRFALYIVQEQVGADERRRSRVAFAKSMKQLLEGQGYTVSSLTSRGRDYTVKFSTFAELPWQKVGTTPARGIAKFTRTADNKLIGATLLCDPKQWSDPGIDMFKKAVVSATVRQR